MYSLDRPPKNERLNRSRSNPIVLNPNPWIGSPMLKLLGMKENENHNITLTTRMNENLLSKSTFINLFISQTSLEVLMTNVMSCQSNFFSFHLKLNAKENFRFTHYKIIRWQFKPIVNSKWWLKLIKKLVELYL